MEPRSRAGGQRGTFVAAGFDVNGMEPMSPAFFFGRARGGQWPPTKNKLGTLVAAGSDVNVMEPMSRAEKQK